jgi:hypothetical protein
MAMPPTSDETEERQRKYRELRERTERQRRRHEQFLERIAQQQRRRLRSFRRPSPQVESAVTESIEGPAQAEDSSVPPVPPGTRSTP